MSPEKLAVSDTAEGEMEKRYLAYLLLSHDAAHALSLVALERHFQLHQRRTHDDERHTSFLPEGAAGDPRHGMRCGSWRVHGHQSGAGRNVAERGRSCAFREVLAPRPSRLRLSDCASSDERAQ